MIQFLSIAFRNMKTVGTICPSSPMLSRELAESAITATSPKRVLEVGPGTGPVTKEILKSLRDGDVLDIVELSTEFCTDLEAKVIGPWKTKGRPGQVTLHNAAIQDVPLEAGSYDCVVCGLPFNNFPPELVERIMVQLRELIRPGGSLRYFAYVGARTLRDGRGALRGAAPLAAIEDRVLAGCARSSDVVMANIPPAKATTVILPS